MSKWEGKVTIITGAGSGIGRELAVRLSQKGAVLILADLNPAGTEKTLEMVSKSDGKSRAVLLDVSNMESVQKLVSDTVTEHGRLDYIFNNAGIGVGGEARDYSYDDWKRVVDVNFYGVLNGVVAAYPVMVRQGFGHIVNTASVAGLIPLPGELSYTASKYAVVGLTHGLRVEAADLGVKVSVVCPGKVETPIYSTSTIKGFDKEKALAMWPEGVTAEKCADIIIRGVERNKATIVVTYMAKLLWAFNRISSDLFLFLAKFYMRKMRKARISD